jgi:hypothetical protein
MNDKLEKIWKEDIMVYTKYYLAIILEKLGEKDEKLESGSLVSQPRFERISPDYKSRTSPLSSSV